VAENVTYTYDQTAGGNNGVGRLTQIVDKSGSTAITYDVFGQITSQTRIIQGQSHTIGYSYNDVGRIDEITYPSGRLLTFWYDVQGRISSVSTKKDASAALVDIAYNIAWMPFGPLQSMTYGNGLNDWNTFNKDYNIDVLGLYDSGTSLTNKAHTRTDNINITNIWDNLVSADNQSFWYTATNRLQNSSGPWGDLTFYHDGAGNLLVDTRSGTPYVYTYNNANRLKTVTVSGNLRSTYIYNAQQQLVFPPSPT